MKEALVCVVGACTLGGLTAAANAAGEDAPTAAIRQQVFQPQFLALSQTLQSPGAVWMSTGGQTVGRPLTHRRCLGFLDRDCTIEVTYDTGGAYPNKCAVSTQDVWYLGPWVNSITWKIKQTTGGKRHRFFHESDGLQKFGVVLADYQNDPNEPGVPAPATPSDVFQFGNQTDEQFTLKVLSDDFLGERRRGLPKVFYYGVRLQREVAAGQGTADPATWEDCDPYDPVIVNRGN